MSYSSKRNNQGFTIIEMIVSVAIGMLILWVTLSLFYYQRKSFTVQEQLSEMQQNLRAAMDIMSREIMMAGYKAGTTSVFSESSAGTITFICDIDSDIATPLNTYNAPVGTTTIYVSLTPDSDFSIDSSDYIYLSEGTKTEIVLSNSGGSHLTGEPDPIFLNSGLVYSYNTGSATVRTVEQITFGLDKGELQITRNTQPLAENIETLSFTYGNTSAGTTDTVTIAITAKTDKSDPHYTGDGYRRGTLTSTIKLRNQ